MKHRMSRIIGVSLAAGICLLTTPQALAHCDTMDGPVVIQAKTALEKKDLRPVLKWVKPEHEAELTKAFARTLAVRPESAAARDLADQFFIETLVRLHRLGEGAPYTGIKPAGTEIEPIIQAADQALQNGQVDGLVRQVTEEVSTGIRRRFAEVVEKKRHAEHQVEAGREYVAAYVEFVHYVEALQAVAARPEAAHDHGEAEIQGENGVPEHRH